MPDDNYTRHIAARERTTDSGIKSRGDFPTDNFWGSLFSNWKTLAMGALLGAVCGMGVYFFVPPKWQATLVVRVGDVLPGTDYDRELLEQMAQTAHWIRSKDFVDALIASLGYVNTKAGEKEPSEVKLFRETLKSKEIPGSQLLRVDYLGYSHKQLKEYADAIAKEVRSSHGSAMEAQLEELKVVRKKYDGELSAEEAKYKRLSREYDAARQDSQLHIFSPLMGEMHESRALIDLLHKVQRDLDRRIAAANRYSAVVTQAEIYARPVFPKIWNFLPSGIFIGIIFGFIFSIFRRMTRFVRLV